MNAQAPSISDALRQVAMVADISTTALGMSRTDKQASKETEVNHAAKAGTAKVVVNRFAGADDEIKAILEIQRLAQENLKVKTMQWGSTKRRLLPNANFMAWNAKHAELEELHKQAIAKMMDNADAILAKAQANIGSFNVDLPTKDEMERAFTLTHVLEPIPDGRHFDAMTGSNGMNAQINEHLRYQFEQNMAGAYNAAIQDAAARLAGPLQKYVERMEAYSKREAEVANGRDPGREGYFRDSIVGNVQEIAEVFAGMNVLNDPVIKAVADKVAVFTKLTPDILRKREDVRNATAARAREIIADLDGFLAR